MSFFGGYARKERSYGAAGMDEVTREVMERYAKEAVENLITYVWARAACRSNGFWCVKCRKPFTDVGMAIVCECPPPPFRPPFIYEYGE